ncbi:MAG: DUF4388 domain-containing protein [Acidimicrobiales bacterium]
MALQGDLSSFALPDVLDLLAGAAKSGRLAVTSAAAESEVWFCDGGLTGGTVSTGRAERTAEVVMELLRFDGGSFSFDDGTDHSEGEAKPVDAVLRDAQALVAEWLEVEAIVPSLATRLTLATSLPDRRRPRTSVARCCGSCPPWSPDQPSSPSSGPRGFRSKR